MPGRPTEFLILLILLILVGIVFLVLRARGASQESTRDNISDSRRILDERYARGELGRDEYQKMRQDIET